MDEEIHLSRKAIWAQEHWSKTQEYCGDFGYEGADLDRRENLALHIYAKNPKRVLEIGTFGGYNLRLLHEIDPEIELFGFDINKGALQYAKEKCPAIQTIEGSIYELEKYFDENQFDVVFTSGVLIHIPCKEALSVVPEIIRISNGAIVHLEEHREQPGKGGLRFHRMRWVHNFNSLYAGHDVELYEAWNPGNGAENLIDVTLEA
jgi:SAM-dependent methyltransferase